MKYSSALERDAFLGQRLLKCRQVQRLAVGNHAVEIEHDGLQRGGHAPEPSRPRFGRRLLARADRDLEPVRGGRIRTFPRRVVRAGGVVGAIEIDHVEARRGRLEIQVASCAVRLGSGREVGEGNEKRRDLLSPVLDKRLERHLFSLQRELEDTDPLHLPVRPGRRRHVEHRAGRSTVSARPAP